MTKIQKISIEQKAYLAGFLDGDGCINAQIVYRKDYRLKYQIRVSITFYQSTVRHWLLLQLQKQIGYGTLRKRNDGISELSLVGVNTVRNFITEISPFLKIKKKQAFLLEQIFEKLPNAKTPETFIQVCEIADKFIILNDSKKRTITTEVVKEAFNKIKAAERLLD